MMLPRRLIIVGLGGLIASPAVVRATSLMLVKPIKQSIGRKDPEAKDRTFLTICDWDPTEFRGRKDGDPTLTHSGLAQGFPITIHLSQSWQISW